MSSEDRQERGLDRLLIAEYRAMYWPPFRIKKPNPRVIATSQAARRAQRKSGSLGRRQGNARLTEMKPKFLRGTKYAVAKKATDA